MDSARDKHARDTYLSYRFLPFLPQLLRTYLWSIKCASFLHLRWAPAGKKRKERKCELTHCEASARGPRSGVPSSHPDPISLPPLTRCTFLSSSAQTKKRKEPHTFFDFPRRPLEKLGGLGDFSKTSSARQVAVRCPARYFSL